MDRRVPTIEDEAGLGRTVALLDALADLVERACGASFVVRFLVLLILRPAEAAARRFVCGDYHANGYRSFTIRAGSREQAILLAFSFRALAGQLNYESDEGFAVWDEDFREPVLTYGVLFLVHLNNAAAIFVSVACLASVAPAPHPAPDTS